MEAIELRNPVKYAGAAPETPREAAMTSATRLITDLLRCVLWLIKHGVYIVGFSGRREYGVDRVVVRVAASPYLRTLLSDCAWHTRRQEGALAIYTWFSDRFGVRIEWEETCVG